MTDQTNLISPSLILPTPAIHRTGTDMAVDLLKMGYNEAREQYIVDRFLEGHVPSIVRQLKPIKLEFKGAVSQRDRSLTIHVSGDYLSLGDDLDYIRCPVSPLTAQRLFDGLGCVMPTVKLVDSIWKASQIKLQPLPWGPPYDASMMSSDRLVKHSHRIDAQLEGHGSVSSKIVAGHKKDVVVTEKLLKKSKSVAIYGWHKLSGDPIQPLYLGHVNTYKDYSHGLRLVSREVWLDDGSCVDILDLYQDEDIYTVFNDVPVTVWRQPHTS